MCLHQPNAFVFQHLGQQSPPCNPLTSRSLHQHYTQAVKYLAGWGVVLSRDLALHAVSKANLFQRRPELAPAWFG